LAITPWQHKMCENADVCHNTYWLQEVKWRAYNVHAGYAALNHWRPCSCRRWSTCLEQSPSRSAPIQNILYFQNTPEVTSVQDILPFSLSVSLTIFVQSPW